jgi:hypothetical protein
MIAAMAAAVNAASTLLLLSGGKSTFAAGVGLLEELGAGTVTWAITMGGGVMTATGALVDGRPTEQATIAVIPISAVPPRITFQRDRFACSRPGCVSSR